MERVLRFCESKEPKGPGIMFGEVLTTPYRRHVLDTRFRVLYSIIIGDLNSARSAASYQRSPARQGVYGQKPANPGLGVIGRLH